ncbi:MAG TPA: bacterial transcriptional activator domain-containing protein [Candidatus Krumholzibacteria bacterium]|nr:bacterial transcriptional activator domain-containing protein [Candidatus Krumholzibacteria bacterium]
MTRKFVLILSLLTLTLIGVGQSPSPAPASPDAPAAVLTSCRGSVMVTRAGRAATVATFGLALNDGDEVRTGADAEAEIMFAAGNWVSVGPSSSMRIKGHAGAKQPAPDSRNFEVVSNFIRLESSEGTSMVGGLRSGDKASALVPVAPVQTKVRDARPTFVWKIDDPSLELRFTIYNESGVHWQSDITEAAFPSSRQGHAALAYPTDAPALTPGVSYSWTLETSDPLVSPPLRTTAAFFEVIAPDDVAALEKELAAIEEKKPGEVTYRLMRASLFFDRGLMADAIGETETAVATDPENGSLHAILGRLYAEAGRTHEAIQEMQKSQK